MIRPETGWRYFHNLRILYHVFPILNAMRTKSDRLHCRLLAVSCRTRSGIQLLQNLLDTGTCALQGIRRRDDYLTFCRFFNYIKPNNTLHASRLICAPWRVTFFLALNHGVV